jgi:hypothetical protein
MRCDYRRAERHELTVQGSYRFGGRRRDVQLTDLSEKGCRFVDRHSPVRLDDEIQLRIEMLGPFEGRVRWRDSRYVGIQFEQPIYSPIFDFIRQRLDRTRF